MAGFLPPLILFLAITLVCLEGSETDEQENIYALDRRHETCHNEQRLGFVASACPDGTPNLSPKGTTTVWDDEHLIFADICSPGTITNVERHPVVEINVVDPVACKGYRFKRRIKQKG